MGVAELKLNIFRIVDQLPEEELQKLYEMIAQLAHPGKEVWETLTEAERAAIEEGLSQLEKGQGKPHAEVMANFRKKYSL